MTFESNYFSDTYDYSTVDSKNTINKNNNNNTSDFYELESKMYQEMNSYYHHPHHRTCAGYNVPPAAYEMRSFGSMATASATPSVHTAPAPPLPPLPLPMPMYQRQHHETRVQQSPTIRTNYNSSTASTSSSATDDWYQPLYMNNRFDFWWFAFKYLFSRISRIESHRQKLKKTLELNSSNTFTPSWGTRNWPGLAHLTIWSIFQYWKDAKMYFYSTKIVFGRWLTAISHSTGEILFSSNTIYKNVVDTPSYE